VRNAVDPLWREPQLGLHRLRGDRTNLVERVDLAE
jgi:hypothetical protein